MQEKRGKVKSFELDVVLFVIWLTIVGFHGEYQRKASINRNSEKHNAAFVEQSKLRIVQEYLVCVTGLPPRLADDQQLITQEQLGKYGKVNKVVVNSNPRNKNGKYCTSTQSYITYVSAVDAAIAINALDGIEIEDREIKAAYGTTKYCTHFLRGIECRNKDCFYLHDYELENEIDGYKNSPKELADRSVEMLNKNLRYLVEKEVREEQRQSQNDDFPSIGDTIQYLLEENYISRHDHLKMKQQVLAEFDKKTSKSKSMSTKASPCKLDFKEEIPDHSDQLAQQPKEQPEDINQQIQKMVIKEIMAKRIVCKSRFDFASNVKPDLEHVDRIKAHIKKFLLTE